MSVYDGSERRKHKRYPVTLKISYTNLDTFFYDYAVNISRGGVYIKTGEPLPVGSSVKLNFEVPGTEAEIETQGKVVRTVRQGKGSFEPPGMGIKFDSLKKEYVELINTLWEESTQP